MNNPFVVGRDVPEPYFCDRDEETRQLIHQVTNGRNVALISPRRLGKTGLISHAFRQRELTDSYHLFFVDLYSTTSLPECALLLGRTVFAQLRSRGERWLRGFFDVVKSLRVGLSLNAADGTAELHLSVGDIASPQTTLEEIFALLEGADRPCIVAMDEFQRIADYPETNVEALLRTLMQRCCRTTFVFSGSKRSVMAMMFTSHARPFYNSATTMGLAPIPRDVYARFAARLFTEAHRTLREGVAATVYDRFEGYTWFVQMVMNELFALTPEGGNCGTELIRVAMDNIIGINTMAFEETLAMLSVRQRELLRAIAAEGTARELTSAAFLRRHRLTSASSVQAATKGLMDRDLVLRTADGAVRLENFFLAEWLRS